MEIFPLLLSVELACVSTLILFLFGIPIGFWLADTGAGRQSAAKLVIEAILTLPLVLPPTVIGFYLLIFFGEHAPVGNFLLKHLDIRLIFSFKGMIMASVIYSLPFMTGPVKNAFSLVPESASQASSSLGKTPLQTFLSIQLPLASKGLLTGGILAFAHTLGEFGIVMMIGGNIPGKTRVASIAIYDFVEQMNYQAAGTYSFILIAISFMLLLALFGLTRRSSRFL